MRPKGRVYDNVFTQEQKNIHKNIPVNKKDYYIINYSDFFEIFQVFLIKNHER